LIEQDSFRVRGRSALAIGLVALCSMLGSAAHVHGQGMGPWCCDLERNGFVPETNKERLEARYAGWEPPALAAHAWTLWWHFYHRCAQAIDDAFASGKWEFRGRHAYVQAAYVSVAPTPGERTRAYAVPGGLVEFRAADLSEFERGESVGYRVELGWIQEALSCARRDWKPQDGSGPAPSKTLQDLEVRYKDATASQIAGALWLHECAALAGWNRFLDDEFARGNYHVSPNGRTPTCGSTTDFERALYRPEVLPNGTAELRVSHAWICCDPTTHALVQECHWLMERLAMLEHQLEPFATECGKRPRVTSCWMMPPSRVCPLEGRHAKR
jgi:hypothetical protein